MGSLNEDSTTEDLRQNEVSRQIDHMKLDLAKEKASFCLITAIFSPCGYDIRYKLFEEFKERIHKQGVKLFVIECIFAGQQFRVTNALNPFDMQINSESIFWIKENLLNIAIARLPKEIKYVAWIDADIEFENPKWVEDTIDRLQESNVVQMFEKSIWLSPTFEIEDTLYSFMYIYKRFEGEYHEVNREMDSKNKSKENNVISKENLGKGGNFPVLTTAYCSPCCKILPLNPEREEIKKKLRTDNTPVTRGQPGLCWAARREILSEMGGLLEFTITGAADKYMAYAFTGLLNMTNFPIDGPYQDAIRKWQAEAYKVVKGKVDYVPGTVKHYWHGTRKNRQYFVRELMLKEYHFEPDKDLVKTPFGLMSFTGNKPGLYQKLMDYFIGRKEEIIT